jgi:hypothetical protein
MWDITRCDEDSDYLKQALDGGWEPFAVTVEKRVVSNYDDYRNRTIDDVVTVNIVWLRKSYKEKS